MTYSILKKILFSLNPEATHALVKKGSRLIPSSLLSRLTRVSRPSLFARIGSTLLDNPLGLAAGFDKNGEMIRFMEALGFGFLELGSVTASPCPGNKKPRLFRLPKDDSLMNRLGLPHDGVVRFVERLKKLKKHVPLGINIAKTPDFVDTPKGVEKLSAIEDYLYTFKQTINVGSYFVFNISCPNTKDSTSFEDPKAFYDLAQAVSQTRQSFKVSSPVLVKLSPDLNRENLYRIITMAVDLGFDGFVVCNTTSSRPRLKTSNDELERMGSGGLSGRSLRSLSDIQIKNVYDVVGRDKIIMGVGGILCFEDLLTKLSLGARYFQIYTGLVYRGPFFIRELLMKLEDYCQKEGVKNYQELVGAKIKRAVNS